MHQKMATILNFSGSYWSRVTDFIFNGFLGCKNFGVDTNITFLCATAVIFNDSFKIHTLQMAAILDISGIY